MLDLMYVICRIYMYVQNITAILYKNTSHSRLHIWKGLTIISHMKIAQFVFLVSCDC